MEPLYPDRPITPFKDLTTREQYDFDNGVENRNIVDNHRTIVSAIQKSPYYVELEDENVHFERYTDKYTKEKDNTKLASFYSYDILSKYIPTGKSAVIVLLSRTLRGEITKRSTWNAIENPSYSSGGY